MKRSALFCLLAASFWAVPATAQTPPAFLGMWGTQGTGPGQFERPSGIAVDPSGVVWVAEPGRIQGFTADGVFLTQWPTGTADFPIGLAADGLGRLHMIVQNTSAPAIHTLHTFTDTGTLLSQQPIISGGCHCTAWVGGPAATPGGDVFWASWARYAPLGMPADTVAQVCGPTPVPWDCWEVGPLDFRRPSAVAVDPAGFLYVADLLGRIRKYTTGGTFVTEWGSSSFPTGVAVGPNGDVFATRSGAAQVAQFSSDGTPLTSWGSSGSGPGQFNGPWGVAVSSSGDIYVTDRENHRVQRFGHPPVPTARSSWGRLKSIYR